MPRLTLEERIAKNEEQQQQLKKEGQQLKQQYKAEQRKKDAHRKILVGATVEMCLGRPIEGEDDLKRLEDFLRGQDQRGNYFSRAMEPPSDISSTCDDYDDWEDFPPIPDDL